MRKVLLLHAALLFFALGTSLAQTGKLSGKITDKDTKEPIPFASVVLFKEGVQKGGTSTDFEGNFEIPALVPGAYDVKVSFVGYADKTISGVVINFERTTRLPIELNSDIKVTDVVEIYATPLIDPDNTSSGKTFTSKDIEKLPTRSVTSIINTSSGVFSADDNGAINIKGARSNTNQYFVNGVKVFGTPQIPVEAISELSVINGGVPAQFGDVTGGVINITTKGPSSRFFGGAAGETSSLFDQWHYNFGSFNLAGPILKKRVIDRNDTTGQTTKELTTLGFFGAIQYTYERDNNPPATPLNVVKDEVRADLEANPVNYGELTPGTSRIRAENIRFGDTYKSKFRPNTNSHNVVANMTVDFQPIEDINISVGGTYEYTNSDSYGFGRSLMNFENNPQVISTNMNSFIRFTQYFRNNRNDENALIKNAYYQVQVDYARVASTTQNREFQDDFFKYNHVGTFKRHRFTDTLDFWTAASAITGPNANLTTVLFRNADGTFDTIRRSDSPNLQLVRPIDTFTYSPSSSNPVLGNYTSGWFNNRLINQVTGLRDPIFDLTQVSGLGALNNGTNPPSVFALFQNVGTQWSAYRRSITEQVRVTALGVAQIRKHAIKIGFEYEQRTNAFFDLSTSIVGGSIWSVAQGLARQAVQAPFIDNQDAAGVVDTVIAGTALGGVVGDVVTPPNGVINTSGVFAQNLFNRFGTLNVDEVDPGRLSLDMFSATELINQVGGRLIGYQGFSYSGDRRRGRVDFNDFFLDTINRPVDAFRPNYASFFIEDKFEINDLIVRFGVRVDRFDANTKVLEDPFSLTNLLTVGEIGRDAFSNFASNFQLPDVVGNDFKVYVRRTRPQEFNLGQVSDYRQFEIVGFRDGSRWLDANGTELVNPQQIIDQGGLPLSNVRSFLNNSSGDNAARASLWRQTGITTDAFVDYEPVINVMPRISFSFPISEDALFYAHYDVLTRRPTNLNVTPLDYYNLRQNTSQNTPINNPNLIPQLTIDYQLGFQQRLTSSSSLKIAAFYRDFRNQIQQVPRVGAYLGNDILETYFTFENIDYGTSKGLTFDYELRRSKNFSMFASYTLMFTEGTGSGEVSNAGINRTLAQLGQQNLRILVPLNFDRRHAFKLNADYRFKEKEGPEVFGKRIFENVGFNLTSDIGSGTPFTRNAGTPQARIPSVGNSLISGQVNSSRLPWQYRFGFRVDKSWTFKSESKNTYKSLNAYLYIQNLLDTRNVQTVYAFTGSPTDDGFLESGIGIQYINTSVQNQVSFVDVYNMALQNPDVFSLPRRIRLGLAFTF